MKIDLFFLSSSSGARKHFTKRIFSSPITTSAEPKSLRKFFETFKLRNCKREDMKQKSFQDDLRNACQQQHGGPCGNPERVETDQLCQDAVGRGTGAARI